MTINWHQLNLLAAIVILIATVDGRNVTEPEQIHLSLGRDSSSEMVVTWTMMEPPRLNEPCVAYGEKDTSLSKKRCGTVREFVDGGTRRMKRWIYRVILTELKPNTRYFYRVYGSGVTFSFKTLREGPSWSPTLLIFGDMGLANPVCLETLVDEVRGGQYDVVLHAGDIGYDMHVDQGTIGDRFMNAVECIAATIPYQVTMGNHESAYNFSHYQERFTMFDQSTKNHQNSFYSFNVGLLHVIVFSSEFYSSTEYGTDQITCQLNWLKHDLEEANSPASRRLRPWIITISHKPLYCDQDRCFDDAKTLRRSLERLFFENEVDIIITGHEHKYQRSWPVYNGHVYNGSYEMPYVNPIAPVQIITGSAGNSEGIGPLSEVLPTSFNWRAFTAFNYSYTKLSVLNRTHLMVTQLSSKQQVVDEITLVKDKRNTFYRSNGDSHFIDTVAPQFRYKIW